MFTGFYTAASGMLMQQRTLNVQGNNLANINTPGFKSEKVVSSTFDQELLTRIEGNSRTSIGKGSPIRIVENVPTNFDPSMLSPSDRPFDMAINGEGYFNVQVGDRTMFTRNGNFDIDNEGYLILRGAGRVMGRKGEIMVGGSDFTVEKDGTVYNNRGRRVDTMLVSLPDENTNLERFANGLYAVDQEEGAMINIRQPNVWQGYTERSNIDMNREMAMVIETQRAFQSCNNALKMIDAINAKTTQIAQI